MNAGGSYASVRTYTGYDEENKAICRQTAADARSYIDIDGIRSKVREIASEYEEGIKTIQSALRDIGLSGGVQEKLLKQTGVDQAMSSFRESLGELSSSAEEALAPVVEMAERALAQLQQEFNEQARANVMRQPNVKYVR